MAWVWQVSHHRFYGIKFNLHVLSNTLCLNTLQILGKDFLHISPLNCLKMGTAQAMIGLLEVFLALVCQLIYYISVISGVEIRIKKLLKRSKLATLQQNLLKNIKGQNEALHSQDDFSVFDQRFGPFHCLLFAYGQALVA